MLSRTAKNKEAITKVRAVMIIAIVIVAAIATAYAIYPTFCYSPPTSTLKIGVLGPLLTPAGRGMQDGVTLAVEDINKRGGVLGHELEIVSYDDAEAGVSKPEKGISGYIKLSTEDNVSVVVGPYSSHVALPLLDYLPKYKTLIVTSGAIADAIDKRISEDPVKYKYFFRTLMNSTGQASIYWEYLNEVGKKLGIKKIAFFYENLAWTVGHLDYADRTAPRLGFEIVYKAPIDLPKTSYVAELLEAKNRGAQAIITLFSLADTSILIREWADLRIPAFITGGDAMAEDLMFWNQTEGKTFSYAVVHWGFRTPITNKTVDFYDRYVERFGYPNFQSYYAYDAVMVWAEAAKTAGTVDPDKVADKLVEIIYEGVAGRYKFSPTSHSVRVGTDWVTGIFVQWQYNGEKVPIWPTKLLPLGKEIVLPQEKEIVLPPSFFLLLPLPLLLLLLIFLLRRRRKPISFGVNDDS